MRRGRPPLPDLARKRYPLAFRATKKLRDQIVAAANSSGRSYAQKMEIRLERSFRDDEVLAAIAELRRAIRR